MASVARPARTGTSLTLCILSLGSVTYALMQAIIAPALPGLQSSFGASESGAGWVLTGFLLSASVLTPIVGRLGDIYGRKRMLIAVLAVFVAGSAICALASSLGVLILGRIVQGAGGGVVPLAFGIIRTTFPPERVGTGVGFVSSLIGVGGGAGVVLAGPIVEGASLAWLFWGPLIVAAITAVAVALLVPDSEVRAAVGVNWRGAALMGTGVTGVLLAATQAGVSGWGEPRAWWTAAIGAALLWLWVRSELRARTPLVNMAMMRVRGVWTANVGAFLVGLAGYVSFVHIPKMAQAPASSGYGLDASVAEAGLYMLPWTLLVLAGGQLAGTIDRRAGGRAAMLAGSGVTAAAFVLLLVAHDTALEILLASAAMGLGVGIALAAMATLTVRSVRDDQAGVASGVNMVMRFLGGAIGVQVAAALLDRTVTGGLPTEHGYTLVFGMSAVALAGAVAVSLMARERPAVDPTAHSVTRPGS